MRIAFVGCGYVADFYMKSLPYNPELELAGVYDKNIERATKFARHYSVHTYRSLAELLEDRTVDIVVNLTNPKNHFTVSKACLEAGKHVYSEKPLATDFSEAEALVQLAKQQGLYLSSAPCSLLGESAQTMWKAIRDQAVGPIRLVYAELDDGLIHRMNYAGWLSESGTPWPYQDEFESGCTVEHAGYYLTWLTAFFGPAKTVTSFAACVIPDKQTDVALAVTTPDFTVGCIEFASGIVARITCSIVADHNHALTVVGEQGTLLLDECWDYHAPVYKQKTRHNLRREKTPVLSNVLGYGRKKIAPVHRPQPQHGQRKPLKIMDFCRGVTELADAIKAERPCRLSAEHALHITEITLTLQDPVAMGSPRQLHSTFDPIDPMPWARM